MSSKAGIKPPFRADHVGSLLRPAELATGRQRWKAGEIDDAALAEIEDSAVRDVVALQESVGLKGVTDGEYRRDYWHLDFMWGFDGVRPTDTDYAANFSDGKDFVAPAAQVYDKVRYPADGIMRRHFEFLKETTRQTPKMTIPAPTMFRHRAGRHVILEDAYPEMDEFWIDLGKAYNDAIQDFYSLGCRYLQLDDVNSTNLCDPNMQARMREQGTDPDQLLDSFIEVNNAAIAGRPDDMVVTTHMCRGNFRSSWISSGGYEAVAEKFLSQMQIDAFFMEYDSERAGDFQPLRFLPKDKMVVLGIVTSKTPDLEPKDELKRRIDEAARFVDVDRLCLSPQCGFSSTHHGNELTADEQRRKLEHIVAVAEEVWGGV
ncbi:MAG: 5-methyltetrahydropteroyltriglutamate--homocysteine S-methyltransferase [Alphaproteobacteria bacterium]